MKLWATQHCDEFEPGPEPQVDLREFWLVPRVQGAQLLRCHWEYDTALHRQPVFVPHRAKGHQLDRRGIFANYQGPLLIRYRQVPGQHLRQELGEAGFVLGLPLLNLLEF
jgi:hypothetical protein